MSARPDELLELAIDAATGRAAPAGVAPAWLAFARTIVAERRAVLEAPKCPTALLRRVQALFAERPQPLLQRVLELVFDSWAEPAAAQRGATAERTLRYQAAGVELDVEVGRPTGERPLLYVAVAADAADLRVVVEDEAGGARTLPLDASGAGRALLPARTSRAVVVLFDGQREIARTPPIALG